MTSESKMEKAFYFRLSAPHRYSRDSLRRESFLKNQKDCGQAAMTEIIKECGFTFVLISNSLGGF